MQVLQMYRNLAINSGGLCLLALLLAPFSAHAQDLEAILKQGEARNVFPDAQAQSGGDVAATPEEQPVQVASVDNNKFTGYNFEELPWKPSIMFSESDLRRFYDTIRRYRSGDSNYIEPQTGDSLPTTPDGLEGVAPPVQEAQPTIAPSYFLNSFLVYEPENWTIWLNGNRVRRNTQVPDLEVLEINKDSVEFLWRSDQMDIISPNWRQNLIRIGEPEPANPATAATGVTPAPTAPFTGTGGEGIEIPAGTEPSAPEELVGPVAPADLTAPESLITTSIAPGEDDNFTLDLPAVYTQDQLTLDLSKLSAVLAEEKEALDIANQLAADEQRQRELLVDFSEEGILTNIWDYRSEDGRILVDSINSVVKFQIGINQTFVTHDMSIKEGYHAPVAMMADGTQPVTAEITSQSDLENVLFEYGSTPSPRVQTPPPPPTTF